VRVIVSPGPVAVRWGKYSAAQICNPAIAAGKGSNPRHSGSGKYFDNIHSLLIHLKITLWPDTQKGVRRRLNGQCMK
jgi:hypothetical protein